MKSSQSAAIAAAGIATSLFAAFASAASCDSVLVPSYSPLPIVAYGWTVQLVVQGLTQPRSILVDNQGALLVVESGKGISRHTFEDNGGTCLTVKESKMVVDHPGLNHGMALGTESKTLYASTAEAVFSWPYDFAEGKTTGANTTVVKGMGNNALTTRTLLLAQSQGSTHLLVSRGSSENFDVDALAVSTGLSQIRSFNLTDSPSDAFDFSSDGQLLGWGLRNSVGLGQHPVTDGIWSSECSIDDVTRAGKDIHQTNPGEELNFLGFLNGTDASGHDHSSRETDDDDDQHEAAPNYGYPRCFAVWDADIPGADTDLHVGQQFAIADNSTLNDTTCSDEYVPPRLTLPPHTTPLDIVFDKNGTEAFITFHGSWDKKNPVGYRLSTVEFDASTGQPVPAADSKDALTDIMKNPDHSKCPDGCFRPVGLAWGSQGRLFMSSDDTGEIFVLKRTADEYTEGKFVGDDGASLAATTGAGGAWGLGAAVAVGMLLAM